MEAFLQGAPRTGIKCMRKEWGSWEGGSVHIPGNRLDQEHSEHAGERWAGLGRRTESSPGTAQGTTKHFGKQSLPGSQRAEQGSFLAGQLPWQESKRYSHCLRSRVPRCLFVSVFISQSVSFSAPQGTGWMQALAFSWNKN